MRLYLFAAAAIALVSCNNDSKSGTQNAAASAQNAAAQAERAVGTTPGVSANSSNQNFTLRNDSRSNVTHIYTSPVASNNWGRDLLRNNPVPPGENAQVTFQRQQNECVWDVKVRVQDGSEHEIRNNNICQLSEITHR